jgi:hypothetical protein
MAMRRGDKIMSVIFAVLLIACISVWAARKFILPEPSLSAEILQDGKIIRNIKLKHGAPAEEFTIESNNGCNVIRVEGDKIAVIYADCPDKNCVRRGWLKKAGDSTVCLPHRLVIIVQGNSEIDGVTY